MELEIKKNKGKPHIILYRRDDGSETWMHSDDFFVVHDLSHFAIEKTLRYTTAFMGMLNKGMNVKDFENREKRKKMAITDEAAYAENMANLFLMEVMQGNLVDFNMTVKDSFKQMNGSAYEPILSILEIDRIRIYLRTLLREWKALPIGRTMKLIYDFKNSEQLL
jgi:hypothetical protein